MALEIDNMSHEIGTPAPKGQSMWGGRFSARPSDIMQAINASIGFDRKLAAEDIAGSRAHATMLAAQGIITVADRDAILSGLDAILAEIEAGDFPWSEGGSWRTST